MRKSVTERREYRQGRYVYLIDDNDHTAWIKVAFWYDDKLESITFPSSLREIGGDSFSNIPNLKQVFIPNGAEKLMCNIPFGKN